MDFQIRDHGNWVIISIRDRLDAFNCEDLTQRMRFLIEKGRVKLAFDLAETQFISLPGIKLLESLSDELIGRDGDFALVGPSEKIKRQFDIFASRGSMRVFRSLPEWEASVASRDSLSGDTR